MDPGPLIGIFLASKTLNFTLSTNKSDSLTIFGKKAGDSTVLRANFVPASFSKRVAPRDGARRVIGKLSTKTGLVTCFSIEMPARFSAPWNVRVVNFSCSAKYPMAFR